MGDYPRSFKKRPIIHARVSNYPRSSRCGYGGGCYDRYLPALRPDCQIVGIAFDEQCISHVPTDAHDLTLPRIISA